MVGITPGYLCDVCGMCQCTCPGGPTYVDPPADTALGEAVDSLIAELLTTYDLDKIPALEPVIAGYLFADTIARIYGESGSFKSFMTLDFAGAVSTGRPWHGRHVKQGLVLYLVAEGGSGVRKRVRAWEQHYGVKMDQARFLPRPVQSTSPEWAVLVEACRLLRPVLIIIDTQARVTVGVEENSATEMGRFVDRVEQLRAASGACVLLVHHSGYQGDHGRGSTSVKGAMQTELSTKRKGKGLSDSRITLATAKQKDHDEQPDVVFKLRLIELDGEADEAGPPITSVILEPVDPEAPEEAGEGSPAHIAALLDKADVPRYYGRDRTQKACQRLGIPAGTDKLAKVVKIRQDLPRDLPYLPVTETALNGGAGSEETPAQTRPGQAQGSNGAGITRPACPLPPSRGGGRSGSPAPDSHRKDGDVGTCLGCNEPMTKIKDDQLWHYSNDDCERRYREKHGEPR